MTDYRRILKAGILLASALLVFGFGSKEAPEETRQSQQGVTGKVEIWEGNFMPMTDPDSDRNSKTAAVGRVVRLYEPVKSAGMANALQKEISALLIAETTTDENGSFYLPVEPGSYSIFVEEADGWYYNGWNGEGVQGAVEVLPGENSEVLIKITTNATF